MRILFAGSPAIAVPSLEMLCSRLCQKEGVELSGVLTNPDSPKGRHGAPLPTEVGQAAERILLQFKEQGRPLFPVLKPLKIDAFFREQIGALKIDLLVSFAFGRFFGPKFMALFPYSGINIHPSLLPKYRGPTPVQSAILNRDSVTGITIQYLAQEMDGGDILAAEHLQLTGKETTGMLSETIAGKAALMLPAVLNKIKTGGQGKAQDHSKASYCSLISRDDGLIDWKESAVKIEAKIRAFDPWPLCRTIHNGRELFILKADVFKDEQRAESRQGLVLGIDKKDGILVQTGEGILAVTELQYSAKKALFWRDFLNGTRDFPGSILG
ncbi:MAG: methionyl-tRNA formyltransferase [Treponema sp.]|jgi:methionyl-tRNA formyltransferase|nr:methionyl-tRNA formyltransferase [Treponema sp.]